MIQRRVAAIKKKLEMPSYSEVEDAMFFGFGIYQGGIKKEWEILYYYASMLKNYELSEQCLSVIKTYRD